MSLNYVLNGINFFFFGFTNFNLLKTTVLFFPGAGGWWGKRS